MTDSWGHERKKRTRQLIKGNNKDRARTTVVFEASRIPENISFFLFRSMMPIAVRDITETKYCPKLFQMRKIGKNMQHCVKKEQYLVRSRTDF